MYMGKPYYRSEPPKVASNASIKLPYVLILFYFYLAIEPLRRQNKPPKDSKQTISAHAACIDVIWIKAEQKHDG